MSLTVLYLDYLENDLTIERDLFSNNDIELLDGRQNPTNKQFDNSDVLVVTERRVDEKLLSQMSHLKLVVRHGTGYDTIDIQACNNAGVAVVTIPNYCTSEVVEHTLAFILSIVRNSQKALSLNTTDLRGPWQLIAPIHRLASHLVGIIGYGQIGKRLTTTLGMLGVQVLVNTAHPQPTSQSDVSFVSLKELVHRCDIISIHSSLNATSSKLINSETISSMKESAWIINTSRGSIIDQRALFKALKEKRIGGAALDVLDRTLPFPQAELLNLDNLIYTPHLAWYSDESLLDIRTRIAKNIILYYKSGEVQEVCVNPKILDQKMK